MLYIAAKLCATVLVTLLLSERCCSLEVFYNNEVNNKLLVSKGLPVLKSDEVNEGLIEEPPQPSEILRYDLLKLFYGGNYRKNENSVHNNLLSSEPIIEETQYNVQDNEVSDTDESVNNGDQEEEITAKRRVIRQAYTGHQQIYPNLPSNPYNPNPSYPNYNPNQNQQWLPPRNNSQPGYSSNGSFNPTNPSYGNSPYNQYNSNYSNYNSAGQYPNYTPSPYSGYRPPNNTMYNSGTGTSQHGQYNNTYSNQRPPYSNSTPRNSLPVIYHPPVNNYNTTFGSGNRYNQSSGQYSRPQNGQNPQYTNPYPNNPYGQRNSTYPLNVPTQRPIYNPSNSYPGHNSVRPGQYSYNSTNTSTWPGHGNAPGGISSSPYGQNPPSFNPYLNPQNPPNNQYPGSNQRNSTYPLNVPTQRPNYNPPNSYPGNNSVRPGQYSYNSTNTSTWPGHLNAPGGIPASPYGQNPPSFNPYLNPQNPPNNQYPGSNQFAGNFQGADTFNLAHGYNPSIPSHPPSNGGPGQSQFSYPYANNLNTQDPTKVNPGYFSYPH